MREIIQWSCLVYVYLLSCTSVLQMQSETSDSVYRGNPRNKCGLICEYMWPAMRKGTIEDFFKNWVFGYNYI